MPVSRKAHPAFPVDDLPGLAERRRDGGYRAVTDEPPEGYDRIDVYDPFGDRPW